MIHADLDLSRIKIILFDADDTLRVCTVEGQNCPYKPDEWVLKPGVREVIARMPRHITFGIVSNQGGVASGKVSREVAFSMLVELAVAAFPQLDWRVKLLSLKESSPFIGMCPHSSNGNCLCRKPSPYLLLQKAYEIWRVAYCWSPDVDEPPLQRDECVYVGDLETDKQAAEAAGFHFRWAKDFFPVPEVRP